MPDPEADYEIDWDDVQPATPVKPVSSPARTRAAVPAIAVKDDRDLAEVQAIVAAKEAKDPGTGKEGVIATGDKVELVGQSFRIAREIGLMPLLKFASAADVDVQDSRALAAMYALLRDCIYAGEPGCGECASCQAGNEKACTSYDAGDWSAFEEHAMVTKADADDLMGVVTKVLEVVSGRPTEQPAGSSAGARKTSRALTVSKSGGRARGSKR
jgi:hypothetical protein